MDELERMSVEIYNKHTQKTTYIYSR